MKEQAEEAQELVVEYLAVLTEFERAAVTALFAPESVAAQMVFSAPELAAAAEEELVEAAEAVEGGQAEGLAVFVAQWDAAESQALAVFAVRPAARQEAI